MQIQLNFDTEKDSLEEIKRVCAVLQEVIYRKEKNMSISEMDVCTAKYREESLQPVSPKQEAKEQPKKETKTAGGCRYIPYEDMSDTMSNIFAKRKSY